MKTVIPAKATFSWTAPDHFFFEEGQYPSHLRKKEIVDAVTQDASRVICKSASLETLQEYYNLSDAIDFVVDGELVHAGNTSEDVPSEGPRRIRLLVTAEFDLQARHGPGAMSTWCTAEIFDEISSYSSGVTFEVRASYVK